MITDSYDIASAPIVDLACFYGEQKHLIDTCLILFSCELHRHLLDTFDCKVIGELKCCREMIPIYELNYKNTRIAFYLSMIGSSLAACNCVEAWWLTGAHNFVMFGSCGSLDRGKTAGKFILPTEAYRGEGCSYYFAPASDYITVKNSNIVADLFERMKLPYVQGRVWTTDSMLRETVNLVQKMQEEGCIAVEMEVAGVQSVCDFYGLQLYDFLEAGDVLDTQVYEYEGLDAANHNLGKLYIGLNIAVQLEK